MKKLLVLAVTVAAFLAYAVPASAHKLPTSLAVTATQQFGSETCAANVNCVSYDSACFAVRAYHQKPCYSYTRFSNGSTCEIKILWAIKPRGRKLHLVDYLQPVCY